VKKLEPGEKTSTWGKKLLPGEKLEPGEKTRTW
jgi:hypothetical protein